MAEQKPVSKNYFDLKSKVWDEGLCSGCGACIAVCPADALYFETGGNSTHPQSSGYCKSAIDDVPCGACYEVCPRLDEQPSSLLGDYLKITAGKAEFNIPKKQSGGAVTAILANALDTGLVDAVVTVTEDPWTLKPHSMTPSGQAVASVQTLPHSRPTFQPGRSEVLTATLPLSFVPSSGNTSL